MKKQPNSEMCFVCGRSNPVGLYMQFHNDGEHEVVSEYSVPAHYQGYPGVVHGGVVAAMLDEVVARVSMIGDHHHFMMSVKLQILYRHPVPVETPLKVVGRILRLRGRRHVPAIQQRVQTFVESGQAKFVFYDFPLITIHPVCHSLLNFTWNAVPRSMRFCPVLMHCQNPSMPSRWWKTPTGGYRFRQ